MIAMREGPPTMTEEEVRQFNEIGAVTMNTPLTAQETADAAAALDRLLPFDGQNPRPSRTCDYYDPALVAIIEHPFFRGNSPARSASTARPLLPNGHPRSPIPNPTLPSVSGSTWISSIACATSGPCPKHPVQFLLVAQRRE
jgi:hypothetical protein